MREGGRDKDLKVGLLPKSHLLIMMKEGGPVKYIKLTEKYSHLQLRVHEREKKLKKKNIKI